MVYLHVPFCSSFCTYCDFYSEIACRDRDAQLFDSFTDAVCEEISRRRDEIEATRDLNTLYIGGGTPSVLPPMRLQRILHQLSGGVPPEPPASLRSDATGKRQAFTEFTIEVNPEDIVEKGEAYVRKLLALGVDRVSMGVQSLDDGILRWMNRRHDAARAREAFGILRQAGVGNISLDLIFGLPQLSEALLAQTLEAFVAWRPEHISAYQLSVEAGSALGRMAREGRFTEAPQEQCAAQYGLICRMLQEAGYIHYEISNWAQPGREAIHNSAYWSRHPYVGLGPSAHSFDGTTRSWNPDVLPPASAATATFPVGKSASADRPAPGLCEGKVGKGFMAAGGSGDIPPFSIGRGPTQSDVSGGSWPLRGGEEVLSEEEAREETIMLGLRTARGIPEDLIPEGKAAEMLADGRLVRLPDGRLRIPEDHWFVSDDIIADLL